MKKLTIIILFAYMHIFCAYSQKENWQFKPDKQKHVISGVVIAFPSLLLMYNATNDWEGSINGTMLLVAGITTGKELFDMLKQIATNQGGGYSWADWSYTLIGGAIGAFIAWHYKKYKQRKWQKKLNI